MTSLVYWPFNTNTWGTHFYWDYGGQKYFQPGVWHEVKTRIKMNTVGQQDGIKQSWFDGELAVDRHDMEWRVPAYPNVGINKFVFSTFHGGDNANYAPDHDQYIFYDNFVVSTTP